MRFDSASSVEEVVWDMRISEEPRAADRATLLKLFNGNPPFDEATADENNIQVNRNDLEGVNILSQARHQWNNAFLKPFNFFTAKPEFGPGHKRQEWSHIFTRHANRLLKRNPNMRGLLRSLGANVVLYGVGPCMWKDRRGIVPKAVPVGSLMIPSETEIDDFNDDLQYFAIFREWTASKLYEMTHGPKVDSGWNMPLVKIQMDYIRDELRKSPNSLAYQYMPERIEELIKQDKGYFGSDAVPTIDVWDFYFREAENGDGWYRRILLDWGAGASFSSYASSGSRPTSKNKIGDKSEFLYSSGHRKYADSVEQILHCQFGDCSAYAPFKYHSIRSLGWMLWGVCDLQNRLHCKFNEAVNEQLMWFFQTAGNQDLIRLKKANFEHMGIIPQGIKFLTPQERYTPNANLIQMAFNRNRQLMADSSTTYTQDIERSATSSPRTATETMAIVNSAQSLASGILELGYEYAVPLYREQCRRLMLKNNPDRMAREFRVCCLHDGIPVDMLDIDKWTIEPEQVVGGGNKTIQMATVGFLNQIRQNLPPSGQRLVDHISVEAATDQPDLAEEIVPMAGNEPISTSTEKAQYSTDRMMRGLPFTPPKDAIFEDYITVWLHDLGLIIQNKMQSGGMATAEELTGMMNIAQHIQQFIDIMSKNQADAEQEKVREFNGMFSQLTNHIKAMAQRLQQQMQAQAKQMGAGGGNGAAEENAKTSAKIEAMKILAAAKAANTRDAHAQRTQQRQISWEKEEARKDIQTNADINRDGIVTRHELISSRLKSLSE